MLYICIYTCVSTRAQASRSRGVRGTVRVRKCFAWRIYCTHADTEKNKNINEHTSRKPFGSGINQKRKKGGCKTKNDKNTTVKCQA